MGRKRSSYSVRGVSLGKLTDYRSANLAPFLLSLTYIFLPWLTAGVLDQTLTIFGLVFLTIAIMRSKPSNSVIAGLCTGFIGVAYLFAVAGILSLSILWMLSIVFIGIFFVFELGYLKFGPVTTKADAFQIVPLVILAFALVTAFAGYGSIYIIDFGNMMSWLNYLCLMAFCFVYAFQLAGWNITKKKESTNQLILVLALAIIATAIMGQYGVLFQLA